MRWKSDLAYERYLDPKDAAPDRIVMRVTLEQVREMAALARLEFSAEEEYNIAEQLSRILDYVEKLEELDVSDVEPMSHVLDIHNVLRSDDPEVRISHADALSNAPDADQKYFRVPKVID